MRYATVIVSPGKNCGCCLFVANACSATLIKSIVISFNVLIITSQYTQATHFLARDYEKRGKGTTNSRTDNDFFDFFKNHTSRHIHHWPKREVRSIVASVTVMSLSALTSALMWLNPAESDSLSRYWISVVTSVIVTMPSPFVSPRMQANV